MTSPPSATPPSALIPAAGPSPTEIEIKLTASPAMLESLRAHPLLGQAAPREAMATTYFDTPQRALAEEIIEYLRPVREKRQKLLADKGYVEDVLKKGAQRASELAVSTMKEVRKAVFR